MPASPEPGGVFRIQQTVRELDITTYDIDLTRPANERLAEVLKEHSVARRLYDDVLAASGAASNWLSPVLSVLYRLAGGLYMDEIDAWAKVLDVPFRKALWVNCAYELEHFGEIAGCTAGLCEVEGNVMAQVRNLDWPIPGMGAASRLFHYRKADHRFVTVSFPMAIGVLSGMVPGAYSVTINWAPPTGIPNFHFGPSFLLRNVLEECRTYDSAVARLAKTELSTSVFFTVCGVVPGQGCVIERTKDQAVVREAGQTCEAQSNHHVASNFTGNNQALKDSPDPVIQTTKDRREQMLARLKAFPTGGKLEVLFDVLSQEPVTNEQSVQRMAFCPARGELWLDRCIRFQKDASAGVIQMDWGRSRWQA